MELIAAAIINGVADESVAFNPMGRTFCRYIELIYETICFHRFQDRNELYSNLIKVYKLWRPRIEKLDLMTNLSNIEEKIS